MLGLSGVGAAVFDGTERRCERRRHRSGPRGDARLPFGRINLGLNQHWLSRRAARQQPLASNELAGALSITSTTAEVNCNGVGTGTESVFAHCSSQATGLVVAVNGQTLLTAEELAVEARATGVGDECKPATPDGTKRSRASVSRPWPARRAPRSAMSAMAPRPSKARGLTGSAVHQQFDRTQNAGVSGSGTTTVALEIELNISGHGLVRFRDRGRGRFRREWRPDLRVPQYQTPTETPTRTPTPALEAVPTPTCAPTATGTPRIPHYDARAPGVAKD